MELEQACVPGHERHYIYNRRQGNSSEARDVLLYYVDQFVEGAQQNRLQ